MPAKDLFQSCNLLIIFIQNLPQLPFCSASFWHLWQTQFYKSKKIFTGKKCFSVLLLYVYLTRNWRQEKQNYLPQNFLWQSLNVDITPPTSLGHFPITGKFPTTENSLLLTVVCFNQRQKCWENQYIKCHRHFKKHGIWSKIYVSNSPWNTSSKKSRVCTNTRSLQY